MKKKNVAYELIKNAIFECKLLPGEALDETALAKLAGVSRTPLREALAALEKEGFVKIIPHRGAFVCDITASEAEQMFDVREVLEAFAIRLATPNIPEDEKKVLSVKIQNCLKMKKKEPVEMLIIDNTLHEMVWYYCGNDTLKGFLHTLSESMKRMRIRSTFIQEPARLEESIREHKEILDALMEGSSEKAERLMQKHVANAKINALKALKIPINKRN